MINGQFDVVFRGQIVKTSSLGEVKANLGNLFKSSPEAIEKLFNGSEVAIKKSLDYTTAMKYQAAIKKAGALALIKEIENEVIAEAKPQPQYQGRATFGSSDDKEKNHADKPKVTDSPQEEAQSSTQIVQNVPIEPPLPETSQDVDTEGLTIASVGAQIMPNKIYEKREVDTSELSLANAGERILPKKAPENHPQPSIDHLQLES